MEIGNVFHLVKAYYCKQEKCFRKKIIPLVFKHILELKKDHTFQFFLVLMKKKFGKAQLTLNSAQFTTVPKHDS